VKTFQFLVHQSRLPDSVSNTETANKKAKFNHVNTTIEQVKHESKNRTTKQKHTHAEKMSPSLFKENAAKNTAYVIFP